ncbi:hypothetical protein AKJ35_01065 [candidate division MSBL1 archaeon SCGC-AAA833F18]|uniref:Uncharacterized protein n=2 Tax=candidate division MSBL1 TaxID=215777 RepID=A0A133VT50_9EURY|nr:hypothetical protein AKJ35_01065 [candidate division MSBL1 archaeon SCGC-AAA833F18]KXB09588.1 hypothetical protein AKJ46_00125 [candidate division MSBL1 archaeon SCGC-AAA833K04]
MKPWEVKETVEQFRKMSGSESIEIGFSLSQNAIEIFANSLGKKGPDKEVLDLIRGGNEWTSRKSQKD